MKLLGIDVGTGGTRAVVVDSAGVVFASVTVEHEAFVSPQTGWAEQDPIDWWRAGREAIRAALSGAEISSQEIAAISLSGQMHGSVLLDESDEVIRPALIWCDQRTDAQCRTITEKVGAARLIELTSNPALTGFTAPKLLWVREEEPDNWARLRKVLLPKDFVRLRLTGDHATDVADASGTLLFDVGKRRWSKEMLEMLEIEESKLPRAFESPEITGRVSASGAAESGLAEGTPVIAGAGDQAAGAVGMGIVRPGAVSATIGTSGVVFAATDRPALDKLGRVHTFCHAIPDRWHVMGVTQGAGLSLRWFKDRFGTAHDPNGQEPYELLCKEAESAPPGSDGVLWAPYLMGERTPHLDPHARAALVGLAANHGRSQIIRSILEGVAFSLRDSFTILTEMNVPVTTIRLGGGGARAPLWRQIQADVYGQPVEILVAEEGAAFGAALLAGVGAGVWTSVDEACTQSVSIAKRIEPEPVAVSVLNDRYREYCKLYPALRDITRA